MDLYDNEGMWFEKIHWFVENGFRVKRIVQKAGDMVVSGPGTLHWVRGFGVALHSAWNIFSDTLTSWTTAYHRHDMNRKISFSKSNIIPLRTLTLKHLDHNLTSMDQPTRELLLLQVNKWFSQEKFLLTQMQLSLKTNMRR